MPEDPGFLAQTSPGLGRLGKLAFQSSSFFLKHLISKSGVKLRYNILEWQALFPYVASIKPVRRSLKH